MSGSRKAATGVIAGRKRRLQDKVEILRADIEAAAASRRESEAEVRRTTAEWRNSNEFVNFADIAEWFSREEGSVIADEKRRAATYDLLMADIIAGKFMRDGKSMLQFLYPDSALDPTPEAFRSIVEDNLDGEHGRRDYLPYVWMPRDCLEAWLAMHNLALPEHRGQRDGRPMQQPRRQVARDRAAAVVRRLYPQGVPDQSALPNALLLRQVQGELKAGPSVSDTTVLRAAGRRKATTALP